MRFVESKTEILKKINQKKIFKTKITLLNIVIIFNRNLFLKFNDDNNNT